MNAFTLFHIAAGSTALLAGTAALTVRKGGRLHARAGTIFFVAMLAMAGTGSVMAALKPERGSAVIGLFTCYLVATSWLTARRRNGEAGVLERVGLIVALACCAAMLAFGLMASNAANGKLDGLPAAAHFPFVVVTALAAALDLNFILRGRLERRQRVARHLWRMCAALFIAAASFFLGQQDEFPAALRGLPIWFAPPFLTLAMMIFWILRVRFSAAFGRTAPNRQSAWQS